MTCDPQSLMDAARCLNCIPMGMMASVATKLLCDLANSGEEEEFSYTPETSIIAWVDGTGPHTGDLAGFRATADIPTVNSLSFPAFFPPQPFDITSISGLRTLPALNSIVLAGNLVETLDCSGCANLTNINANGNLLGQAGGVINVTGCTALQFLTCDFNANLTTIVGLPDCPNLGTLTCTNCAITALDVHACAALVILQADINNLTGTLNCNGLTNLGILTCSINPALTGVTVTGCTVLNTLDCSFCAIAGVLDLSGLSLLTTLTSNDNLFALTSIKFTGCVALSTVFGDNCTALTTLTDIDDCSASLTSLSFVGCDLTGTLDLSNFGSLVFMDVNTNTNLTAVVSTNCTALQTWNTTNCNLTNVDASTCVALVSFGGGDNPNLVSVDASNSVHLHLIVFNNCPLLSSLSVAQSDSFFDVEFANDALPDTPNGINDLLVAMSINSADNHGTATLNGGTNSPPTPGPPNGQLAQSVLEAGAGGGWLVFTNP